MGRDPFQPDYRIPPGEILGEYLEVLGISDETLAARMGIPPETVEAIIRGRVSITAETAIKLERMVGRPAHFWRNLERIYREGNRLDSGPFRARLR
jgi:HTH-type transcriptional regulator / antitoxin HigA